MYIFQRLNVTGKNSIPTEKDASNALNQFVEKNPGLKVININGYETGKTETGIHETTYYITFVVLAWYEKPEPEVIEERKKKK